VIRLDHPPRPDWETEVEKWGMFYHTFDGEPYWYESAHYEFTAAEIDQLEDATTELHRICLAAVDTVVKNEWYQPFGIDISLWDLIKWSWEHQKPGLYGRFDLGFDGVNPPKLYEYNADTPTALLEAAVIQWQWLQIFDAGADQFNSIWEGLIETWQTLSSQTRLPSAKVWFAHEEAFEDLMTVACLRDAANEAGLETAALHMPDIGWDARRKVFTDLDENEMTALFKLYPYEWLVHDNFAPQFISTYQSMTWIEPAWKMILSNKAILAILWQIFPDHPNLLPAFLDQPSSTDGYVRKPLLGREGANVTVYGLAAETPGQYGDSGYVYQARFDTPSFGGAYPVLGSWVIGDQPRGMGIRESNELVTDDRARFVPHLFRP
jgi:glutathionylspermidine synthase